MNQQVEVGIIGEYDPNLRHHIATNEALNHAASALSISLKLSWISTQSLSIGSVEDVLKSFHGIWGAPGHYKSMDGALRAIQFAREYRLPFIGT
jgi:CTP synthase (UTP-ammonia lyase)